MLKSKKDESFSVFVAFIFVVLMLPIFILYSIFSTGFCVQHLWEWFITPFGLKPLSLIHAYGLSLLIVTMRPIYITNKSETDWGKVIGAVFSPWISLLVGYIIKCWM